MILFSRGIAVERGVVSEYPFALEIMARPIPVFPDVGSTNFWPASSTPRSSASAIRFAAIPVLYGTERVVPLELAVNARILERDHPIDPDQRCRIIRIGEQALHRVIDSQPMIQHASSVLGNSSLPISLIGHATATLTPSSAIGDVLGANPYPIQVRGFNKSGAPRRVPFAAGPPTTDVRLARRPRARGGPKMQRRRDSSFARSHGLG